MERSDGANDRVHESGETTDGVANAQGKAAATGIADNRFHLPANGNAASGGKQ